MKREKSVSVNNEDHRTETKLVWSGSHAQVLSHWSTSPVLSRNCCESNACGLSDFTFLAQTACWFLLKQVRPGDHSTASRATYFRKQNRLEKGNPFISWWQAIRKTGYGIKKCPKSVGFRTGVVVTQSGPHLDKSIGTTHEVILECYLWW